jgi:hypothetical protein
MATKVDGGDNDDNDFEIIEEDLPDEICDKIVQDNPDEVEESEHVQHLREVILHTEYRAKGWLFIQKVSAWFLVAVLVP